MIEQQKKIAAEAAITYLKPEMRVGIGTGSTVNYFIKAVTALPFSIQTVASSQKSAELLRACNIEVLEANQVSRLDLYIDGADEIDRNLVMIKGGGKALTGEKILAAMSDFFICIAHAAKRVKTLGAFPLPIEVIASARSMVARKLTALGGTPIYRVGEVTDYGNVILDVWNLAMDDPLSLERELNQIPGIVTNGLFAQYRADLLLLGNQQGVETYRRSKN